MELEFGELYGENFIILILIQIAFTPEILCQKIMELTLPKIIIRGLGETHYL